MLPLLDWARFLSLRDEQALSTGFELEALKSTFDYVVSDGTAALIIRSLDCFVVLSFQES